jgi:ribosomal-protein-alanine N-acetyltransferase
MEFETLSQHHSKQLLEFEVKNRLWFESFIEPRETDFYTHEGVNKHINLLSKQMRTKEGYSGVLVLNGQIVARANLKDISNKSGFVGYRVAQDFSSQGLASYCLSKLLSVAQNELELQQLKAMVLENNPASMRVLQKHGFIPSNTIKSAVNIHNKRLDCIEMVFKYV